MRVLVIDNYDSFTYNLVHLLKELGAEVTVRRNDKVTLEEVAAFEKVMLSPGPGIPVEAGNLLAIIEAYASTKSILGICLGHQAIAEVFGGELTNLSKVFHGVATNIQLTNEEQLFNGLPENVAVGRYHSWNVTNNLPDCLEATAFDEVGNVMAIRHKEYDVAGFQFHPESILTPDGRTMLSNWVND